MDEAQRTGADYERTTPDGNWGREGGDDQSRQPTQLMDKAKEQIEPGMEKARESADAGMDKAAEGLESAAERLKGMTEEKQGAPAQAGIKLAEGMESAATYLKEHNSDELLKDLESYVKHHPAQALAGAIFAGFLVGRMLR
jgi:hypothetical protein